MLNTQKLRAELERTRSSFASYQRSYGEQRAAYQAALCSLGARFATAADLHAAQDGLVAAATRRVSIGARPTGEYDRWHHMHAASFTSANRAVAPVLPLNQSFANHAESRAWAERVRGITTFAVDGSQILPWRDASVPLALVQVGLFENPHQPPTPYIKDVSMELLTPDDLVGDVADDGDVRSGEALGYETQIVHLRRFEREAETLASRIHRHAGQGPAVAFSDGSLIVSFALKMPPPYRERYVTAARALLQASESARVPLVGYIDTSYARDVLTMLRGVAAPSDRLPETRGLHDALLWQGLLAWGDRSPAFLSARDDLARMGYAEQQADVAFVYLQATRDRPPARIEFPRWMLDDGALDDVMDVVRAELIAGNGYPYPIEAADGVAVISAADRAQFYALFQEFAAREDLAFSFSHKSLSKTRRRV